MSNPTTQIISGDQLSSHRFKYFDIVMAAFVAVMICANIIGAGKVAQISILGMSPFVFGAGVLFFPLSYVIGDILTEVYGLKRARRVIWVGFGAAIFAAMMAAIITAMPPADGWNAPLSTAADGTMYSTQNAFARFFAQAPRIVGASVLAFWLGEMANAVVMSRMKVWTKGKHLWSRTIGSTVVGQGIDSLVFYPLAFLGLWETKLVITVMISNFVLKVLWEAVLTPVTYFVVNRLKRAEQVEALDI